MAKTKNYFDEVDIKVNFPELEEKLLKHWEKSSVIKRYITKNKTSKRYFSFLDGPITANNPMGVHHAWGRTYKDLWQRFKNMQGFRQRFQNGFDCQGLWVEVEVEKELGLKTKKDIENLVPGDSKASIAKFVELCKERVYKYAKIQTNQSQRLGYFMDWGNSYFTLSEDNNYMNWHFLKVCFQKGLIYKGHDTVPWCPRCGTAISQHEILTEDYKELTHETVFFKVPLIDKDFSLLVWTTTPWTIPANAAVAVNPNFKYRIWKSVNGEKLVTVNPSEIKDPESYDWFQKHLANEGLEYDKVTKDITGKDLVGLSYNAPFDHLPRVCKAKQTNPKTFHTVIAAEDLVVATKGTGILHVAPGAGEEDYKLGQKENIPVIEVIDEEAKYYDNMADFSGKNAKKHPELIIDYLKDKKNSKFLFKSVSITHRYPACWRCKTELVWRVVDEWYIAIDPVRNGMKKVARKINWRPKFGLKREIDWLNNMHDWLISKKRYWGLTLPIWECTACGSFEVIGSKKELRTKAVEGWDKFEGHTPHRPWVDEVKIKCKKCGNVISRIDDVGNPWLDAGIVSFSTISEDNKSANPNTKGSPLYFSDKKAWKKWIPADFITESFPGQFKNWFYSLIAMSTVLENIEPFKTVLGFGTLLAEDGRPMHKSWGNSIEFNEGATRIGVDVMRWMYARQDPATNLLFGYKIADEVRRKLHLKLWNVYNFFVTYANMAGWLPEKQSNTPKSKNILDLWIMARLNKLVGEVTTGLEHFEALGPTQHVELFVEDLSNWYIRRSRDRVGVNYMSVQDSHTFFETTYFVLITLCKILAPFMPFISEEIYRNLTKEDSVHLTSWPTVDGKIDNQLIEEMGNLRIVVEDAHAVRKSQQIPVRQPLSKLTSTLNFKIPRKALHSLLEDELNVKKWIAKEGRSLKNLFDIKITHELEDEAKTRELIRKIQNERKNIGTKLDQYIIVTNPWIPESKRLVSYIKKNTLTKELKTGDFKVYVSSKAK